MSDAESYDKALLYLKKALVLKHMDDHEDEEKYKLKGETLFDNFLEKHFKIKSTENNILNLETTGDPDLLNSEERDLLMKSFDKALNREGYIKKINVCRAIQQEITAEAFYDSYIGKLKAANHRCLLKEIYNSRTEWTSFIISALKDIVSNTFHLETEKEYFRIDVIGYHCSSPKKIDWKKMNRHCWDLDIAIEHENDYKDWIDEIVKLAHIKCRLKVVIGYVKSKDHSEDKNLLGICSKVLEELSYGNLKLQSPEEKWLVILGTCDFFDNVEDGYKGYTLKNGEFISL
jgi:hypothetical protein